MIWMLDVRLKSIINEYTYNYPSIFHLFDRKFLIDFNLLIECLEIEFSELKIEKSEVEEYVENGYFPELYLEDGKRGFMIHTKFLFKILETNK